ncbi:MAG: M50 family metallopeptidase [Ruminococcus sp.]|nr:M50 family metallopeptidase [Ruminococcus sp.]
MRFSFLVLTALLFLLRDEKLILSLAAVCAVHEAGHLTAMSLTGARVRSVTLSAAGIRIETVRTPLRSVPRDILVLLAGPFANVLMYILLTAAHCPGSFPMLNLAAAAYNLLPYRTLDGGAVVGALICGTPREHDCLRVLRIFQGIVSLTLLAPAVRCGGEYALPFWISLALFAGDLR